MAFTAGLLNAQPMGFWSPQSLLADAKRHGTVVRRPDVNASGEGACLEGGRDAPVLRLGLAAVRGIGSTTAARLVAGRPWAGSEDLVRRGGLTRPQLEALALAGALDGLAADRSPSGRRALVWTAGAAAQAVAGRLPGVVTGGVAPPLPAPAPLEAIADDLWSLGVTPERTAIELVRPELEARGVVPASALGKASGGRVTVAGVVTHRQQPETAGGAVFLNLEDETGMVNVVCSRGLGPLVGGGPGVAGPGGAGAPGALGRGGERGGRAVRAARPRPGPRLPGLPLTYPALRARRRRPWWPDGWSATTSAIGFSWQSAQIRTPSTSLVTPRPPQRWHWRPTNTSAVPGGPERADASASQRCTSSRSSKRPVPVRSTRPKATRSRRIGPIRSSDSGPTAMEGPDTRLATVPP